MVSTILELGSIAFKEKEGEGTKQATWMDPQSMEASVKEQPVTSQLGWPASLHHHKAVSLAIDAE